MATLVLLGGNDPKNKERLQEVKKELLPFYDTTHVHNYRHRSEGGNMDFEYECDKLCEYLKGIKGSIIIFAKSFGCILALKAIVEKEVFIKQCIFVGFPLGYCENTGFPLEKYLKELTSPVLRIQKTNDPAAGYNIIAERLVSISPAFIGKEMPGDDHAYLEVKKLKQIILDANAT